ncbi:MAG: PAS domain-containing protein [Eubacteriales bacterium]|nr:PAS domain-containing protein [Eubacteriales bacterium]
MEEQELHPSLQAAMQLMDGISKMLGSRYELILHDLSRVENSVVAVRGNITDRQIGAPVTNYLLQLLKVYGDKAPDCINYRSVTPDGRILRSSTMFIRDGGGRITGSLCVNQDLTDFMLASRLSQELTAFHSQPGEEKAPQEQFARDITEVMEIIIQAELEQIQKPVAYMQKEDKLALVKRLEDKGIFDVKGSVEYVAERLAVTNFTIYNYLKEIRGARR